MVDFSFTKMLLVAVIALVVLGPEKLPKAARMAGVMLRRVRSGWESVRREVERELETEELRHTAQQMQERAHSFESAVSGQVRTVQRSVNLLLGEAREEAGGGGAPHPEEPGRHGNTRG